jgi:hypothetical protein
MLVSWSSQPSSTSNVLVEPFPIICLPAEVTIERSYWLIIHHMLNVDYR